MEQACPDIEQSSSNYSPHTIRPTSSPNFNNLMSPMQIKEEINSSEDKNISVKLEENQENNTSKNGNGGSPNLFPINNNDLKDLDSQNDDTENENQPQQQSTQQQTSQQQTPQSQTNPDDAEIKHTVKTEDSRGNISNMPMPKKQVNEYAQQQSQIFVYPTNLANKAAEAVDSGEFDSIIDYHCSQEETKKILALHPLNTAQFNRQAHPNWFEATNNRNRKFMPSRPQFTPNKDINPDFLPWDEGDGSRISDPMGMQPSLQGVKVPDENLTPQQRQHREEQLATIRKLTKMFCLENQPGGKPDLSYILGHMGGPMPPNGNIDQMSNHPQMVPQMRPPHPGQMQQNMQRNINNMVLNEGQMGMSDTMRGMDPNSMQAKLEWERIQKQHFNELNGNNRAMPHNRQQQQQMMVGNNPVNSNNIRPQFPPDMKTEQDLQPPPPYHLTSRPMQNSNPASPINPPSNISLPSPRTSDPMVNNTRQLSQSNPSTPIQPNLSPGFKEQGKDSNLMPVPSPQQIPFLNSFEGQEQTIQKEPNTKAKEDSFQEIDKNLSSLSQLSETSLSEENKGQPTNPEASPRPVTDNNPLSNSMNKNDPFSSTSPDMHMRFSPNLKMGNQPRPFASPDMGNFMDGPGGPKPNPASMVPSGTTNIQSFTNARTDNIPLNPNSTVASISKASHFDPISSLAQMSQQLTSNTSGSMNSGVLGGPGGMMGNFNHGMNHGMMGGGMNSMNNPMDGGMMPGGFVGGMMNNMPRSLSPKQGFGDPSMGMSSMSPKLGMDNMGMAGPRMMGRPPLMGNNPGAFNGTNVQVKPNAPNTIQYLPARPQIGNQNPRPPPSLEFLQRYTNPMPDNMNRMPGQSNMPYYNPQPGNMPGQNMGMPMMNVPGGMPHGPPNMPMMGQGGMMRGMRPVQNNMMRMQGNFNEHPGPNNGGVPMFGMNGGKDQQMLGQPQHQQPGGPGYPPNMPNRFKSPEFSGQAPAPGNPNYAQQYHNFQQQLYATNTRN